VRFRKPVLRRARSRDSMRRTRGFVSLLVLLVLLSAGSALLLRALNQRTTAADHAAATTRAALSAAREALLGYAVRYPDTPGVVLTAGPGRLPCPDTRLDRGDPLGAADSPCAQSSGTETGRFPWHTLGLPELQDGSGAPLWYAVSNNFRAHLTGAINNETRGTLKLDDCAREQDIVALIIAPGAALEGQNRRGPVFDVAAFLEGENASRGDGCFSGQRDVAHNDHVLAITRTELMRGVEQRVLREVRNALHRYTVAHGAMPWLSPWQAPEGQSWLSEPGITRGQLPLRRREASSANPHAVGGSTFAFAANFALGWTLPAAGTVVQEGEFPPLESCLRSSASLDCTSGMALSSAVDLSGPVQGLATGEWQQGQCKAQRTGILACEATRLVQSAAGEMLRRIWTVVLTRWPHEMTAPSATSPRLQHFRRADARLGSEESLEIRLRDELLNGTEPARVLGSSRMVLGAGAQISAFALEGVPFDLEVDDEDIIDPRDPVLDPVPDTVAATRRSPGELPFWLVSNRWHEQLLVAWAPAWAPGAEGRPCAESSQPCLEIATRRADGSPALRGADVAVVLGGPALRTGPLAQQRPAAVISDFFEGANVLPGRLLERQARSVSFNDRLLIFEPGAP